MVTYETVRKNLKTGDILLFSGKGGISHGIKLFTFSKWSHVGMVLRLPDSNAVFLWESTTLSNLRDAADGKKKNGVQLVLLRERLDTYDGEVSLRRLNGFKIDNEKYMDLMAFREEVRNRSYEKNEIELIKAAYDGPWGHNEEDLSSLFCSELVAEAYQRVGLLTERKSSNEFTPKDFSDEKKLDLPEGVSLSKEVIIT
ncbi:MAG: YiiX/YebB-like N1pC/P60 family cysteine hydrolase [Candidatus Electryonea clarkiae]|nr:YiiX/YebB-like N1pC/P60 family cysteine hydrolase [Candidatus Electryonea clarkiae]